MSEVVLFKETQRFNQWWLWLIIIAISLIPILMFDFTADLSNQLTIDKIIPSVIVGLILVLFLSLKMSTTITEDKIIIKFFPFFPKEFTWEEVDFAQVIDYGFVGGWGIRLWTNYGTVYNVRGSKGLHLKVGPKQYVIGTQQEKEMRSSIAHLLK